VTQPREIDDVIATQIRQYRLLKGWSVKRLAEECERLGASQLTSSSLGNIERGQDPEAKRPRRRVGVAELAVLASALDVPPLALIVPTDDTRVEITDHLSMTPLQAIDWFTGLRPPGRRPTVGYQRAAAPVRLYAAASQLTEQATDLDRAADRAGRAGDDEARSRALEGLKERLQELAHTLNSMVDVGIQSPALDPRWIDLMTTNGWLKHPDRIAHWEEWKEGD
jgi:transcriptional regulator with XRE-family HTH domain